MVKVRFLPHEEICPNGLEVEAEAGETILEVALRNDIEIEHACEMSCACSTCHCIVRKGFDSLNEISDQEEDMLDRAWGLTPESRLSCQAVIAETDLEVEIPRYSLNHAKEH